MVISVVSAVDSSVYGPKHNRDPITIYMHLWSKIQSGNGQEWSKNTFGDGQDSIEYI